MKRKNKARVRHANGHSSEPRARRAPFRWIVLGILVVAALSAALWALRSRTDLVAAQTAPADDLRQRTAELIGYASSIPLAAEQEKVKAEALSTIRAPCGNRNSLAVRCCGCNLFKSIGGLANHLIARDGADAGSVRQAVLDWIGRTNPGDYSGAACDSKRCERPFREDGCGGMSEARLVM